MNLHTALLAVALGVVAAPAAAVDPSTSGALPVAANRLVGLWTSEAAVSPCGSGQTPSPARINTIVFNAGGTAIEMATMAPAAGMSTPLGFNQRSNMGLGRWSFNAKTGHYTLHLRFDWFVDGQYQGFNTVDRTILLSNDGTRAYGPVKAVRYAADGSIMLSLCGTAVSTRV